MWDTKVGPALSCMDRQDIDHGRKKAMYHTNNDYIKILSSSLISIGLMRNATHEGLSSLD